jgi:hypothetical protein
MSVCCCLVWFDRKLRRQHQSHLPPFQVVIPSGREHEMGWPGLAVRRPARPDIWSYKRIYFQQIQKNPAECHDRELVQVGCFSSLMLIIFLFYLENRWKFIQSKYVLAQVHVNILKTNYCFCRWFLKYLIDFRCSYVSNFYNTIETNLFSVF